MKKIVTIIFIKLSKCILPMFYDRSYLKGKWYEDNETLGWKWGWRALIDQKLKGYNSHIPFPVNPTIVMGNLNNLTFSIDNIDNFWKNGSYYQCWNGKIHIGKNTWIAQNVGIITENHDLTDLSKHLTPKNVHIGDNCWIGMNSTILPGVKIGNNTIIGAGSVVTKSFESGNCVIAGNPARIIKNFKVPDNEK